MKLDADKIFDLFKRLTEDAKLNAAIKASKDFKDLSYRLLQWVLPIIIAASIRKVGDLLGGKVAASNAAAS